MLFLPSGLGVFLSLLTPGWTFLPSGVFAVLTSPLWKCFLVPCYVYRPVCLLFMLPCFALGLLYMGPCPPLVFVLVLLSVFWPCPLRVNSVITCWFPWPTVLPIVLKSFVLSMVISIGRPLGALCFFCHLTSRFRPCLGKWLTVSFILLTGLFPSAITSLPRVFACFFF